MNNYLICDNIIAELIFSGQFNINNNFVSLKRFIEDHKA